MRIFPKNTRTAGLEEQAQLALAGFLAIIGALLLAVVFVVQILRHLGLA